MPDAASSSETQFVERVIRAARLGGASELDLMTLRQLVLHRHGFDTMRLALRVQELEHSLSAMDPGARRNAICERLSLSRRRFYELKNMASAAPDRTGTR